MRAAWMTMTVAVGCAKAREPAPKDLDTLAHEAFRAFETPTLTEVAAGLADWLDEEGGSEAAWEGYRLTNLTASDIASIDVPAGTDLSAHVGISTSAPSPFDVVGHATLIVEPDQTWTDPKSFDRYDREVFEGDPSAFARGSGHVRTRNDIVKSGAFGVTIPYTLRKDYRWVALPDGTSAIAARGWLEETGCSDNGKNCVLQSWGVELFHGVAPGQTHRLYIVWLEVVTEADGLMSEDGKIGLIAKGNQDILESTDEELAARGF